jgi:hypothetical protein
VKNPAAQFSQGASGIFFLPFSHPAQTADPAGAEEQRGQAESSPTKGLNKPAMQSVLRL